MVINKKNKQPKNNTSMLKNYVDETFSVIHKPIENIHFTHAWPQTKGVILVVFANQSF